MIVRRTLMAVLLLAPTTGCAAGSEPSAAPAGPEPSTETSAAPGLVVVDCVGEPQVRPGDYVLTCADANDQLQGLHWTSWGPGTAVASGHEALNDCTPSCAEGRPHSYPVSITLSNPSPWTGHPTFTRFSTMTLRYTGVRPAGTPASKVETLPD